MSNYIDPERGQFEAFKELPRDKPIMMLNLLRFREKGISIGADPQLCES